tara:strand:- start:85 stop:528 length:444 start_codon:yes stop_codon:yes gene_type:complete
MKVLAIGDTREEIGNCLYGSNEITNVYVFNNPDIKTFDLKDNGNQFTQIKPQNNDYTHWELEKHSSGEKPVQLKKLDILRNKWGIRNPKLSAVGINPKNLIELTDTPDLSSISEQTGISFKHLHKILDIQIYHHCPVEFLGMARKNN